MADEVIQRYLHVFGLISRQTVRPTSHVRADTITRDRYHRRPFSSRVALDSPFNCYLK
jgi:hypothetical protein